MRNNQAFVEMEYFSYLRRDPDNGGFTFWLGKLNQFGGDFRRADMVKSFLVSGEYRQRFGPPDVAVPHPLKHRKGPVT
jgi:hypothetical protein